MSSSFKVEYQKKELPKKIFNIGISLLAVGLILSAIGYFVDSTRSSFNNIVLLMFLISIGLGSMFLVAVEYVAGADWSVPFRRIAEFFAAVLLAVPVVVVPLLFNLGNIFHWMHPEIVNMDKILIGKAPYLNTTFFIIRVIIFFALWILFYFLITRNSLKQDQSADQNLTRKNIKISAVFIPVFAITITFAAIDWMMSLEPHWFSTIFGIYYFSGSVLAGLSVITIAAILLNKNGYLVKGISNENYYSLGALLFAFTNFWAYIAFSQYLLIWYANLPEETFWFLQRWEGGWMYFSIGLLLLHFLVPYVLLLSQPSKTDPKRLLIASSVILFSHIYDIYWIVKPNFSKQSVMLGWNELGFLLLAAGIVILVFVFKTHKNNFVAIGDPKLKRGIDFRL